MRLMPTPFIQHQNEFTSRIDQTLGSKDSFWFRYSAILLRYSRFGRYPTYLHQITDNPGTNYGASGYTPSARVWFAGAIRTRASGANTFNVFTNLPASATPRVGIRSELRG